MYTTYVLLHLTSLGLVGVVEGEGVKFLLGFIINSKSSLLLGS